MNAPATQAAFTAARIRTASDAQPTVADSIVRAVARMPIRDQIALVQQIVEGADWGQMGYVDGDALDKALIGFLTDLDEEDLAEHQRLYGPAERSGPGYWL